jgi:uncharacterized membrane protein
VPRVRKSIEINAPLEDVFAYVADYRNAKDFLEGFTEFQAVTGQFSGLGARARASGKFWGVPVSTVLEISEFEENQCLVSRSVAGIRSSSAWGFQTTKKGVKVTFTAEYSVPGLMIGHLMERLIEKDVEANTRQSLINLKRIMERDSKPPASSGPA